MENGNWLLDMGSPVHKSVDRGTFKFTAVPAVLLHEDLSRSHLDGKYLRFACLEIYLVALFSSLILVNMALFRNLLQTYFALTLLYKDASWMQQENIGGVLVVILHFRRR